MAVAVRDAKARLEELGASRLYFDVLERFRAEFPDCDEVIIARAPGRVNVIGEHTDYNGLPVFPMALDREIVIAFSPTDSARVELVNVGDGYPRVEFELSGQIPSYDMGHWGNYIKAAAQAAWQWTESHAADRLPLTGVKGVVGGNIPSGSGLSSSSALVVAGAVAIMRDLPIEKPAMADLLAKGERYVGTEGGGMDQAVSLLNQKGFATKIDFAPLNTRSVRLPAGYAIVVANSMVSAKKTGGARDAYNTRVAECKLGLAMLVHDARNPAVDNAVLLRDFMVAEPRWRDLLNGLPDGAMTIASAAAYVGMSEDELKTRCLTRRDGTALPIPEAGFQPKKRCRHVLTEGARVEQAAEASERGDAVALGRLMDESHASCADDYEISVPELDTLVGALRRHGAMGARLTGAGFGGCTASLVESSKADALIDGVWKDYYSGYLPTRGMATPADRDSVIFACMPNEGAGILL
jgi:N-acetylgalactosamine kinase